MPGRLRRSADARHVHAASDADEPGHPRHHLRAARPGRGRDRPPCRARRQPTRSEPFVQVLPFKTMPATRHVRGTNLCLIGVHPSRMAGEAILVSVLDNLVKGASGQAIQNMNLMLGLDERLGLGQRPLVPVSVTAADIAAAAATTGGPDRPYPVPAVADLDGHHRRRAVVEVREPPVYRLIQGARRAQLPDAAVGRAGGGRRGRDVGRQSCAGRGLSCTPPGHSRDDRDAQPYAVREGGEHAPLRRPRRARGRRGRGGGAARLDPGRGRWACASFILSTIRR